MPQGEVKWNNKAGNKDASERSQTSTKPPPRKMVAGGRQVALFQMSADDEFALT